MFWRRIRIRFDEVSFRMKEGQGPSGDPGFRRWQQLVNIMGWRLTDSHFSVKNPQPKPTHPLWQVETRPLALGLRAPPNLAKARLWDYLFFGCNAGTGDSWEAQFLINWPFNGCKAQLSKNARLSQEVCFWEKMDQKLKRQRKTRKQHENTMCIQSFRVLRPMLLQKHYVVSSLFHV